MIMMMMQVALRVQRRRWCPNFTQIVVRALQRPARVGPRPGGGFSASIVKVAWQGCGRGRAVDSQPRATDQEALDAAAYLVARYWQYE
jgi:hypothetical protein